MADEFLVVWKVLCGLFQPGHPSPLLHKGKNQTPAVLTSSHQCCEELLSASATPFWGGNIAEPQTQCSPLFEEGWWHDRAGGWAPAKHKTPRWIPPTSSNTNAPERKGNCLFTQNRILYTTKIAHKHAKKSHLVCKTELFFGITH